MGGALEGRPHGLSHPHETPVEQLQGHRVRPGRVDGGALRLAGPGQPDQVVSLAAGTPAGRYSDLGVAADDQGRAIDLFQGLDPDDWSVVTPAPGEHGRDVLSGVTFGRAGQAALQGG